MIRMGQRTRRERLVYDAKERRVVAKPVRGLIPTRVNAFPSPSGDGVSPAKGIFAFHYVGEKLIGLFGRLSVAPPPDSESAGQNPGQTTQDDSHLVAHDDSLVQPSVAGKVRGAVAPMAVRQGSLTPWNCGFCSFL